VNNIRYTKPKSKIQKNYVFLHIKKHNKGKLTIN